ncbi:MAG TPA: hypothetical protein DCS07_15935 [Bdellovibrionales bacterium]|nr:MAG: hypothetical protein A2X97_08650 [Bdellovibrionales bacterium GWA1_52_35]HAR44097.1 hypothetical protein [Bdellovibrionales bacterium]HCM41635.1 hypothetical protein [Bdellovibrionales bacterium]
MKFSASFLAPLFVLGCSTHQLHVDSEKIKTWSDVQNRSEPFELPYAADFKSGPYFLTYIAVEHENDKSSPTFKLIENAFKHAKYDAVIIEGVPFERGASPSSILDTARRTNRDNFFEMGEPGYAAILADSYKIPFFGGEPPEQEIKYEALKGGLSGDDLVGFYFVRQVPQWFREKKLPKASPDVLYRGFSQLTCLDFNIPKDKCLSFDSFKGWYSTANNKDFLTGFESEEAAPIRDGKYKTQRIAAQLGRIRDRSILNAIITVLKKHKSVLVVYGGGHFATQLDALTDVLGKPTYWKKHP